MSIQDLPPDSDETATEPEDVTVRRLVRAIDFAEGFWLGFAKSNTPAQRRRLTALCCDLLEPLKIRVLEIELNEPVTDLLPVLRERLAREAAAGDEPTSTDDTSATTTRPKLAVFVHGLERSIPSREAYPPLLSSLNLKRELFRQEIPHPLLLWLHDYALTALARKSPDLWAWRSGLYEFAPEREAAEQSLEAVRSQNWYATTSLSEQAKRERLVMLKGLLDDYRELGEGLREQRARANILEEIGQAYLMLGEWDEAKEAYGESLSLFRALKDGSGEVRALATLGRIAHEKGEMNEAERLYRRSLEIAKSVGIQQGIASSLYYLGMFMQEQGEFDEAQRLYNESLQIAKSLDHEGGVSVNLFELARLADKQGQASEARRLYSESLEIAERLGHQSGVASCLDALGKLAQDQGEIEQARKLYVESLEINKRLGQQDGVAYVLHNLGTLAAKEGNKAEAARLFREALNILGRLGSPNAEITRRNLAIVEGREDILK